MNYGKRSADILVRVNLFLGAKTRGQGCPRSTLESALWASLVPQNLDRVESRSFPSGIIAEGDADHSRHQLNSQATNLTECGPRGKPYSR